MDRLDWKLAMKRRQRATLDLLVFPLFYLFCLLVLVLLLIYFTGHR